MFEIHKRHSPMFVTSDIKKISNAFMASLGLRDLASKLEEVEILPIFHTARINEKNSLILKSDLKKTQVCRILEEQNILSLLRQQRDHLDQFMATFVKEMKAQLNLDSYICIGEKISLPAIQNLLPEANEASQRPLIIFNANEISTVSFSQKSFYDLDHPALWLRDGVDMNMDFSEAYFAISPSLKMEVELNRFEDVEIFGNYLVGMVRF